MEDLARPDLPLALFFFDANAETPQNALAGTEGEAFKPGGAVSVRSHTQMTLFFSKKNKK